MEEYPPVPNKQSPVPNGTGQSQTPNGVWKVGLLEFGFVAVVLFLLFGVLNYFNILSVSDAFPKYLSWLPRQNNTLTNNPLNYSPIPTPTPTQTGFQYDTKKAEILLTQYIKDTIKPEFLPEKIDIQEGLTIDGRMENVKSQFGFSLTNPKETVSANFHFKENTNTSNDFSIFIEPKTVDGTTATVPLANSLLNSYFTNPYAISSCQTKGNTSYCENFQALNNGKQGYGIVFVNQGAKLTPLVFNCIVPKENKNYDSRNSCISP